MTSLYLEKGTFYSPEQQAALNPKCLPRHIAIIPDGNRRWARKQDASINNGHKQGADVVLDVIKASKELGIKVVTLYSFSTENWNRPKEEIEALFFLLDNYLKVQKDAMVASGIRLGTLGDLLGLPQEIQETILEVKNATAHCRDIDFIMALNYGGRDDICRATKRIVQEALEGKLKLEQVTEEKISSYLDTAPYGDPELFIRTSGELRLSNFLLWQLSYSEIYSSSVLWPDFNPHHLYEALLAFQKRDRRIGA